MSVLRDKLADQEWRLNNLYWIVDEHGQEILFKMNETQWRLWRNRAWRNCILKSRQLGVTTFVQLLALDCCVFRKNFSASVIAHTKDDATKIFRDKIKFAYDRLPEEIRRKVPAVKNEAGELLLANGSGIRVTTSARSGTVQFLHVSELGKIAARFPEKAREIITGSLPAVHGGNYVFIEATAEGREGRFYDLAEASRKRTTPGVVLSDLDFRFHFFAWYERAANRQPTPFPIPDRLAAYFDEMEAKLGVGFDNEQRWWYAATEATFGDDMKREHPATVEESWEQTVEGAYYQRELTDVYRDGRVREVACNPEYPVHTSWDIGEDGTAIWFFQVVGGGWVVFLKYLDGSGEGLEWYVERLRETGWRFGRHIGPHDLRNREWGTGKSRLEQALELGVVFELAPQLSLADGIGASRQLLKRSVFSENGCPDGLTRLAGYKKKWNQAAGAWMATPMHDFNSHGADGYRMAAVSDVAGDAPSQSRVVSSGMAELIDRGAK